MSDHPYDVVIVGGGPAGSTCGGMIRRYDKDIRVLILEREIFPRDHVGESQLPFISFVLRELGVWDKVEAAGFPIKIGASYTWGSTTDPWEFEFLPLEEVEPGERPQQYEGWRKKTAFQVDRAKYDKVLLDHAEELGCEVRQGVKVEKVVHEDDEIKHLELSDGSTVSGSHYVDASGNAAVLRKALGVKVHAPTKLQNVAFWDYWENVRTNDDTLGHGITRVQIRSVTNGWIWFIPLSETRASVGFVCPASYYKEQGKSPRDLYFEALKREPRVWSLLEEAEGNEKISSTTDWSFVSERGHGKNWALTGETLGFADPILAAGLTLTHFSARHCAYNLLEQFGHGEHDPSWLWEEYDALQFKRVRQHMRFAEFWYSANGCFDDLRDYCQEIAQDSGLKLTPEKAFQWLSNGGIDDIAGEGNIGGVSVSGLKGIQNRLLGDDTSLKFSIEGKNIFKLNLVGASEHRFPDLVDGRVRMSKALKKGEYVLPLTGQWGVLVDVLKKHSDIESIMSALASISAVSNGGVVSSRAVNETLSLLEPLVKHYWVNASVNKKKPALQIGSPAEGRIIYTRALREAEA